MSNPRPELFPGLPLVGGMLVPVDRTLPPVPLKHTAIQASVVGPICDLRLTQRFHNTHTRPIEALYAFPLPEDAAVSELTLTIGSRLIRGLVRERDAARLEYEQARDAGQGAALLEQQRPNIFSISVANIQPDEQVEVSLRFHDRLSYDDGGYELVLPTVVLPRYTPRAEAGDAPPHAPILPDESRDGHTLAITLELDAGKLEAVSSPSHDIDVEHSRGGRTIVTLRQADAIPNKDFVLRYRVAAGAAHQLGEAAAFTVRPDGQPGTLLLTVVPALDAPPETIMPRELLFVFDRSGSMGGDSIVQARNALRACLRALNPGDTFNIFPFDHEVEQFQPVSQPFTQESVDAADAYIATIQARGGTEILGALQLALRQHADAERLRVVVFLTDGAVGNEETVLRELGRSLGAARVFAFGIGTAVNRFLLDKLAEVGRGSVEYVFPGQGIEQAVQRFQGRAAFPLIRDLEVDWGGAQVVDVYPRKLPDLYAGQPLNLLARFHNTGRTTIVVTGRTTRGVFRQGLEVEWPAATPDRAESWRALPQVWARARIDDLLAEGRADATRSSTVRDQVLALALEHSLLSPYTSFVAVEERRDAHADRAAAEPVVVPIHLPQGTIREAFEGPPSSPMMLGMALPSAPLPRAMGKMRPAAGGLLGGLADAARGLFGGQAADAAPTAGESGQTFYAAAPASVPAYESGAGTPTPRSSRERAEAGLRYLARTQGVSGSWGDSPTATALAQLAFLVGGHTDRAGSFRPQLTRAVAWLTSRARQPDAPAIVAWVLAELAAVTGAQAHRDAAADALAALAEAGDPLDQDCRQMALRVEGSLTGRVALDAAAAAGVDSEVAIRALLQRALGDELARADALASLEPLQAGGGDADGAVVPPGADPRRPSAALFAATAAAALLWTGAGGLRGI